MKTRNLLPLILAVMMIGILIPSESSDPSRADSAPVLSNHTLNPTSGGTNTVFNFTIFYSDGDGDAANNVTLFIDGSSHDMSALGGYPVDWKRGVPFCFETKLSAGWHYYYFKAVNVNSTAFNGNYSVNVRSSGPELTNFFHSPQRPTADTGVSFNITYSDPNGTMPKEVKLYITDFSWNATYSMTVSTGNYSLGVGCLRYLNLSAGNYSFFIKAVSGSNETVRYPKNGMQSLHVSPGASKNSPPMLYASSVSPSAPSDGDTVHFSVKYMDIDNDAPLGLNLAIRKSNWTKPRGHNLSVIGSTYIRGVTCFVNLSLTGGTYTYFFQTLHYNSSARKYEAIETANSTLNVSSGNIPTISSLVVTPSSPVAGSPVNVSVTYKDPLGGRHNPSVKIFIHSTDGPSSTVYSHNMTRIGSNFTSGVTYYVNLNLTAGNYSYYIGYWVYNGSFRHPSGSNQTMYVRPAGTDTAPQLGSGGHIASGNNVTFHVTYKDADGDSPRYINLNIGPVSRNGSVVAQYFNVYNMNYRSTSYTRGVRATYTLNLANGSYKYYFDTFSSGRHGNGTASYPVGSYLYLNITSTSPPPPSDSAPVLYSPSVIPSSPVSGNSVAFSIYYKDKDGDAPSNVTLVLGRNSYSMRGSGTTYSRGVSFGRSITMSTGNYTYFFKAVSGNLSARYPSNGSLALSVRSGSGGTTNRTGNNSAAFRIDPDSGEVTMDIIEVQDGLYLEFEGYEDGRLIFEIRSDEIIDRVVSIDIDEDILGRDLKLLIDGNEMERSTRDIVLSGNGDVPIYSIDEVEGELKLTLFIPDATSHSIEAYKEDEGEDDKSWTWIIISIIVFIIVLIAGISVLTSAQIRKKQESFYRDFDLDTDESENEITVSGGKLDKDEALWEDLLE